MTRCIRISGLAFAYLPAALVLVASACKLDCPDGITDRHGYQCTPIPTGTETSTATDTSSDTFSTSSSDVPTSSADTTTSDETYSTTTPPSVCGDDVCDPDEDADGCYDDCGACGNAVVEGPEPCDNGTNQDDPYSPTSPAPDACAPGCAAVEFCGDAIQNGSEPCDDGEQTATCEANCTPPTCGDGTVNPLAGEACDDSNTEDGDGCSADCSAIERRVFATSTLFFGDLNYDKDIDVLTGIPLADARCTALALAAGLSGTYKAWLSDGDFSPESRFDTSFSGLYRLPSAGFPVIATGWQDLIDGTLAHAIDADEMGTAILGNVWTNTLPDGTSASANDCDGWKSNGNLKSFYGQSSAIDATWTNFDEVACSFSVRLYCFEDP